MKDNACRYLIEAWGDLASRFQVHMRKGSRVQIHGSLKVDRYNDKQTGAPQTKVSINVASAWMIDPASIPPETGAHPHWHIQQIVRMQSAKLFLWSPGRCWARAAVSWSSVT